MKTLAPPFLAALLSSLLVACPKDTDTSTAAAEQAVAEAVREVTDAEGNLIVEVDLDRDGTPDIYDYYHRGEGDTKGILLRKEVDLNRDGRIDLWTTYNEDNQIAEERMDSDFDGNVDWVDHYQGGVRVMSEVDTDFDKKFDTFKYFEGNKIKSIERDTDGNGKVDYWEYFDDQGNVIKIGWDVDGDGQMDVRKD